MKKKKKIKKSFKFLIIIIIIGLGVFAVIKLFPDLLSVPGITGPSLEEQRRLEEAEKQKKFLKCMDEPLDSSLLEELENEKQELDKYLNRYKTSVVYENLKDDYYYQYNENKIYFAASLIKLVDAIYIYENANKGAINLDEEVEYKAVHKAGDSEAMGNKPIGTKESLRKLVEYALTVSDNISHLMLYDYIGYESLKEYASYLNLKIALSTTQKWGNITASEVNLILKEIYRFTEDNNELGVELETYMKNDKLNTLSLVTENSVAHKYGLMKPYYHDVGIVYDKYPYSIVVLTEHSTNYETVVKDIHTQIIDFHQTYYTVKENFCYNKY